MWILQCVIVLPGFTVVRLARAVAVRIKKNMKNSSSSSGSEK